MVPHGMIRQDHTCSSRMSQDVSQLPPYTLHSRPMAAECSPGLAPGSFLRYCPAASDCAATANPPRQTPFFVSSSRGILRAKVAVLYWGFIWRALTMPQAADHDIAGTSSVRHVLWPVAVGLLLYCCALTVSVGDFGFEGDDWWVFSWPFWTGFPGSLRAFARDCLRPVEGVYWICLFEVFGFDRVVFHVCSLLLSVTGCVLMGLSLSTAFPDRRAFAALAALFAFFLPTVSSLTYVLATDNSRLSLLLFWASALAFQRWALHGTSVRQPGDNQNGSGAPRQSLPSWAGLAVPVGWYVLSFLTYEAASLLLFAVPLLVLPVWQRAQRGLDAGERGLRGFLIRLVFGIVVAFSIPVAIRFLLLGGGAVGHRQLFPSWDLLWSYPALLPFYMLAPFSEIPSRPGPWMAGAAVTLWVGAILFLAWKNQPGESPDDSCRGFRLYAPAIGMAILFLGMLPYQMAGYGAITPKVAETALIKWGYMPDGYPAWFNFNWSSRIYSAGSFGVAILLAWVVTFFRRGWPRTAVSAVVALNLGASAAFHVDLGNDWKQAGHMRNELVASLVNRVPGVEPDTGFVFLDLECSWGRAAVFRGWNGLRELICMIYGQRGLGAWYLYPHSLVPPNHLFPQAVVSPDGFATRGMRSPHPAPLKSLLVLKRNGSNLVPVNAIVEGDGTVPTGICWKGTHALTSHMERVRGWCDVPPPGCQSARDLCNSGLLESLELVRVKPRVDMHNRWMESALERASSNAKGDALR
jgi:hypothetical protein